MASTGAAGRPWPPISCRLEQIGGLHHKPCAQAGPRRSTAAWYAARMTSRTRPLRPGPSSCAAAATVRAGQLAAGHNASVAATCLCPPDLGTHVECEELRAGAALTPAFLEQDWCCSEVRTTRSSCRATCADAGLTLACCRRAKRCGPASCLHGRVPYPDSRLLQGGVRPVPAR